MESLEARIRELERENAKLTGQVQAGYADALKMVFLNLQHQRGERVGHADGVQGPRGMLSDSPSVTPIK
jgi:hypothetical protein